MGKMWKLSDFIFLDSKISVNGDYSHKVKRHLLLGITAMSNLKSILKSRDIADKGLSLQSYGFSSSHVWMWELDHNEGWVPKNWCFWTLRRLLRVPLTVGDLTSHPKGNQSWIFIGRTDATSKLWPHDMKSCLWQSSWCCAKLRARREVVTEGEMAAGITESVDVSFIKLRETVMEREAWTCCS